MCDPLIIAGLALEAGSVVANSVASNSDAQARNQVLSAEIKRNQQLDQQAAAINAHTNQSYENFVPQQDAKAQQLGDYFNSNTAAKPNVATSGVMPTSGSDIVNQDEAAQLGKANDFSNQQGTALGELRSFGDLLGDKTRTQARDATAVGQIGNNETGFASNVVPYQLNAASHSGDTARTLGDVLALGGTAVGGYGAMRNPSALVGLFGGPTGGLSLYPQTFMNVGAGV